MKKFPFLSVAILVVGFCACISCSYFLSNVLVGAGLFANNNVVSTEKQTFFAICINSCEIEAEAQKGRASLQNQNGAGYVYQSDRKFHLLASVFENKADAELVKNNLASQDVKCEILSIEIPAANSSGNFSVDQKNVLLQCMKASTDTFKQLYDVAISLDTNVLDNTKAKLECNKIYSSLVSTKANFDTMFGKEDFQNIKQNLERIENHLTKLISEEKESENQTFSSLIKLTYCKILLG